MFKIHLMHFCLHTEYYSISLSFYAFSLSPAAEHMESQNPPLDAFIET